MNKEVMHDNILQEDIEILANKIHDLNCFKSKTIFISGSTGLLCSQMVKAFLCCNRLFDEDIKIIAFARSEQSVQKAYGELLDRDNFKVVYGNIMEKIEIEDDIDFIMHAAGITGNSKNHILHPTVTINTAVLGTHNVLELAKEKNVTGMVYFSSWEVYGITDSSKECIYENDYGYMDVMEVRRCHGESKRLCENMCLAYASEFGVPVSIGRIPLTFGPGVREQDTRVFAQFARSVINQTDIVLKTEGKTLRNHCYIRDALSALLTIMIKGERCDTYNIVNPNTAISIIDMAKLCANLFEDSKIEVKLELEDYKKFGYNPELKCLLNSDKLQALGWAPEVDIEEMYRRMILSMKNGKSN